MTKKKTEKIGKITFQTKSAFYQDIICSWIMRTIIMLVIFFYSIFELTLYLGLPYIVIAFYLIFIKFLQYKGYRFFYKIEFDDDARVITLYYRDNLIKKGKYVLPYSELDIWRRRTILSTSIFIKDKRKEKFFRYIGAISKEYFFGNKYWNKELFNSLSEKFDEILNNKMSQPSPTGASVQRSGHS